MSPTSTARTALDEMKSGAFQRRESVYRNFIRASTTDVVPGEEVFLAENNRYHIYHARACPWAHRAMMVRALKGLEDVFTTTVVHPVWQKTKPGVTDDAHCGWVFSDPDGAEMVNTMGYGGPFKQVYEEENSVDTLNNCKSVRDLYELSDDTEGKYTVPIIWDKKLKRVVNNESSEIIRMINSEFNEFAKNPNLDLYPEEHRQAIDAVNEWIYPTINNGVYRCGFATTQEAYNTAIQELTASFDRIEEILKKQKFIAGDFFSEADVRLFVTLVRFDEVYTVYFKCNTRFVRYTPAIMNYCKRIYKMPGVADTIRMDQIKDHYYCSHPKLNIYSIVPMGADFVQALEQDEVEL